MENNTEVTPNSDVTQKNNGKFLLIAAILSLVVIAFSILFICLGGIKSSTAYSGRVDIFDFFSSENWKTIIDISKQDSSEVSFEVAIFRLQFLFGAFASAMMLIVTLIMSIRGIISFVRGRKTGNFNKTYGSAFGVYAAFLGEHIALITIFNDSLSDYKLTAAALAGIIICGVAMFAIVILRLLSENKENPFDKKTLISFILSICCMICVIIMLIALAQPPIQIFGLKMNFSQYIESPDGSFGIFGIK